MFVARFQHDLNMIWTWVGQDANMIWTWFVTARLRGEQGETQVLHVSYKPACHNEKICSCFILQMVNVSWHWSRTLYRVNQKGAAGGGSRQEGGHIFYLQITTNNHKNNFAHEFGPPRVSPDLFRTQNEFSNVKITPDAATLTLHAFK